MRTVPFVIALAAALLAGPRAAAQDSPPFEPTGELQFYGWGPAGSGASFDGKRLVGSTVNLTRRDDGTWAGDLVGQNMNLKISQERITGANVNLHFTQKGGRTGVEGLFFGARVRLELDGKRFRGRFGACSLDLRRKARAFFHGDVGCQRANADFPASGKASLKLIGEAAEERPPLPQFALALLAILPG